MKNRILATALMVALLLGLLPGLSPLVTKAAAATNMTTDSFGFSMTVPDDFKADDGVNPYGSGKFNFNPVKELGVYAVPGGKATQKAFNFDSASDFQKKLYNSLNSKWYNQDGASIMDTLSAAKSYTNKAGSASNYLKYPVGAAFDPTGSGRDDCTVYLGLDGATPGWIVTRANGESYFYRDTGVNYTLTIGDKVDENQAAGYLPLATGDFDGDGHDTMVMYSFGIGGTGGNLLELGAGTDRLEFSKTAGRVSSYPILSGNESLRGVYGTDLVNVQKGEITDVGARYDTAIVHLAAGDLNGDGTDELVVTVSLPTMSKDGEKAILDTYYTSSTLLVLEKDKKDASKWNTLYCKQMDKVAIEGHDNSGRGGWFMRSAASAIGDIDGDGNMEIITLGSAADDKRNYNDVNEDAEIATITDITVDKNNSISCATRKSGEAVMGWWMAHKDTNGDYMGRGYDTDYAPMSIGCVRFDGTGTQPYVLVQGRIYKFDGSNNSFAAANTVAASKFMYRQYIISQPIVGNFDGNVQGREQVFFAVGTKGEKKFINGYLFDAKDGHSVMAEDEANNGIYSCDWETGTSGNYGVALTAPDIDTNDGMVAEYKSKEYTYTDPEIMAILEASPYFEDLSDEYPETLGSTSFGISKGSGSETSETSSTRAGTYMSFEQDFEVLGVKVASMEMEASYEAEWSSSMSMTTEYTVSTTFDAGRRENKVVLLRTPVIVYHYNVWDANNNPSTMSVTQAQKPVYSTLSVEAYNELQETTEKIDIPLATPGQPGSYRSDIKSLPAAKVEAGWVATTSGADTTNRTIETEKGSTVASELTHSIDAKAGGGAGGVTIGASVGSSTGSGKSVTDTSRITRSGTVANVPEGYEDYGFSWNFVTWDETFGTGKNRYTVPVLGYLVDNVKQPPSVPKNVEAIPETNAVTLNWDSGANSAASYEIFQYADSDASGINYFPIGTVSGSETTFTHEGLNSGTQYQYCLRSVGYDSAGKKIYSNYTAPVSVITGSVGGTGPKIVTQPKSTNVLVGRNASFELSATPGSGGGSLSYQWQSRAKAGDSWKNMSKATDYTLTLDSVESNQDGSQYRCMVSQWNSAAASSQFTYSKAVTLGVGTADSNTTVKTEPAGGGYAAFLSSELVTGKQNVAKQYKVTIGNATNTYERYANDYTAAKDDYVYYCKDDSLYYLLAGVEAGTEDTVTGVVTTTATGRKELTVLGNSLVDDTTGYVAGIADLHSTKQKTAVFNEVTYNVFTATGVAQSAGANLVSRTLTLYQKVNDSSDTKFYVDSNDGKAGEDGNPLAANLTEVTAHDKEDYSEGLVNKTYLGTPEGVWLDSYETTKIDDKTTYKTVTDGDVTLYRLDETTTPTDGSTPVITYTYFTKTTTDGVDTYTKLTEVSNLLGVRAAEGKVTDLAQAGELTQAEIEVSTNTITPNKGQMVTITATVTSAETLTGYVRFAIVNTSTGATRYEFDRDLSDGVSATWTPPEPGVYQITAAYSGSETVNFSSASTTYYAMENPDSKTGMRLDVAETAKYGDVITASLNNWTFKDGQKTDTIVSDASFAAYPYVGGTGENVDKDGYSTTAVEGWTSGQTLLPGNYLIKATSGGQVKDTGLLTVTKRAVTITAPEFEDSIAQDSVEGFNTELPNKLSSISVTDTGTANAYTLVGNYGKNYADLLQLSGAVSKVAGNYDIRPEFTSDAEKYSKNVADFMSKYIVTFVKSVVTVSGNKTVEVSFSAGANGTLTVFDQTAGVSISSGAAVETGHKLIFTATPNANYLVSQWTKNSATVTEGVTESDGNGILEIASLTEAVNVSVSFTDQKHSITLNVGTGGKLIAEQFGQEINSGTSVSGGSTVTLTATPNAGMVVKQWSVTTGSGQPEIQKNDDGTVYAGKTLTLDNISAKTTVSVEFEASQTFTVTYSVVDKSGNSSTGASISAEGLTEQGKAEKGSTVTLKAALQPGSAVQEWQQKQADGSYKTAASSQTQFVISNLQADMDIHAVVASNNTIELQFSVVDSADLDTPVEGCGTLSASSKGQSIKAGSNTAYIPVDFRFKETDDYEVVKWTLNEEDIEGQYGKTSYHIDSLSKTSTVKVVVQKKPLITITQPDNDNGLLTAEYILDGKKVSLKNGYAYTGTKATFTATPNTGYVVDSSFSAQYAYADTTGKTTDAMQYIVENVQADIAITPAWTKLDEYKINFNVVDTNGTATGGFNGDLTAAVERKGMDAYAIEDLKTGEDAYNGSTVTFTAKPDTGYRVQEWFVDGEKQPDNTTNELRLEGLSDTHTVSVTFVPCGGAVTWRAEHGAITGKVMVGATAVDNGFIISAGASAKFTAKADTGYEIQHWTVNNVIQPDSAKDTFTYTAPTNTENTGAEIVAVFQPIEYTVSWAGDSHGGVTANGLTGSSANVRGGTELTFTAVPNEGYVLSGWSGAEDGAESENSLTWTVPVGVASKAYNVAATFAPGSYTLSYANPDNGTLTCNTASGSKVSGDTMVTLTAHPANGYIVSGWKVNGEARNITSTAFTIRITKDTEISVTLAESRYAITFAAQGNGTVKSNKGESGVKIDRYGSITFTAEPAPYYMLDKWLVDGVEQAKGTETFVLSNVTQAHEVTAVFAEAAKYAVGFSVVKNLGGTLSATANGTPIQPQTGSSLPVVGDSKLVFTAEPAEGKMVKQWKVNDVAVSSNLTNTLTIERLTEKTDVSVEFEDYAGYAIPEGTEGYTVTMVSRTPADTYTGAPDNKIRRDGTVSFTVSPNGTKDYVTISVLAINGWDCIKGKLAGDNKAVTNCSAVSAVKNANGSYTVTVAGVSGAFETDIEAHKVIVEPLVKVPDALNEVYKDVPEEEKLAALESDLKKNLPTGSTEEIVKEIVLKYQDGENQWVEVSEDNFPISGVEVSIKYSALGKDADKTDNFTVTHMFTTVGAGHKVGDVEVFRSSNPVDEAHRITKGEDAITFRVTAMSPFAIAYTDYVAPQGGAGGAGDTPDESLAIVASTGVGGTIDPSGKTELESGADQSYTIKPKAGYLIDDVLVDGKTVGRVFTYAFEKVEASHTIEARFVKAAECDGGEDCISHKFTDVDQTKWYHEAIDQAVWYALFSGTSETTFDPDVSMTRAMLATVLYRAAGSPSVEDENWGYPFVDVDADSWYGTAVYWARLNKIVSGTDEEHFSPDDVVTREQLATMIYRWAGSPDTTGTLKDFTDAGEAGSYATKALCWCVEQGILTGSGNGILDPRGEATRAQVAALLIRYLTK